MAASGSREGSLRQKIGIKSAARPTDTQTANLMTAFTRGVHHCSHQSPHGASTLLSPRMSALPRPSRTTAIARRRCDPRDDDPTPPPTRRFALFFAAAVFLASTVPVGAIAAAADEAETVTTVADAAGLSEALAAAACRTEGPDAGITVVRLRPGRYAARVHVDAGKLRIEPDDPVGEVELAWQAGRGLRAHQHDRWPCLHVPASQRDSSPLSTAPSFPGPRTDRTSRPSSSAARPTWCCAVSWSLTQAPALRTTGLWPSSAPTPG